MFFFETGEREMQVIALEHWARKPDFRFLIFDFRALRCIFFGIGNEVPPIIGTSGDERATGIGESEEASNLVEAFTDRVILRLTEYFILEVVRRMSMS